MKICYNIKLTKNKARFGRLLRSPAWKRNRSSLEGVDKLGSKLARKKVLGRKKVRKEDRKEGSKQTNNLYSAEIDRTEARTILRE